MPDGRQPLAALRRLLQALQSCGQVMPFSTVPAALAAFHSVPHCFCRACMASRPLLGLAAAPVAAFRFSLNVGPDAAVAARNAAAIATAIRCFVIVSPLVDATRRAGHYGRARSCNFRMIPRQSSMGRMPPGAGRFALAWTIT